MKNKTKLFAFITICIVAFSVFYYFKRSKSTTSSPQATPIVSSEGQFTIESDFSESDIVIPTSLFVYKTEQRELGSDQIEKVLKDLGFTTKPTELKSPNFGTVYVWSDKGSKLRIDVQKKIIDYRTNVDLHPTRRVEVSEETLKTKAKSNLSRLSLLDVNSTEIESINYLSANIEQYQTTEKSKANLVDIKFRQKIDGYKILNTTAGIGTINVKLTMEGLLSSIYIDLASNLQKDKEYPIKNYTNLKGSLYQAKIQLLDNGSVSLLDFDYKQLKKIIVKKASIAYLKDGASILIRPIFVLEGEVQLINSSPIPVLLHLPALSDSSFGPLSK